MELIEVELPQRVRLSRSVEITEAETGLDRGLRAHEVVVIKDRAGAAYLALVREVSEDSGSGRYRLELGQKIQISDQALGEASRRLADIDGTRVPRPTVRDSAAS